MQTKSMKIIDNELYIGTHRVADLAKTYQTPLYVYDEVHIKDKITTFQKHFKSKLFNCEVVFASKAFLAPYMADIIHQAGFHIDSVSLSDLHLLKTSQFPMQRVLLHGHNKTEEEILYAIENQIGFIVVDNVDELLYLDGLVNKLAKKVSILIRVNPGIYAHTHSYIKTSLMSSKFGESIFDEEKIKLMMEVCMQSEWIELHGFHAHIGSNINYQKPFVSVARVMLEFAKRVFDTYGYHAKVINLGGGFGIKYLKTDAHVDLAQILKGTVDTVNRLTKKLQFKIETLMIEPGRSIVGDAGFTIYKVGGIKNTFGGKKYVFIDGGMTDNIRPALYHAKYTIDHIKDFNQEKYTRYDVVGRCCESGDIVANDVLLGDVKRDDYLIIYATGAYGYSMSSNYNGVLRSSIIFVNDDQITEAIRRQTIDQLHATYNFNKQPIFDVHTDILYDVYQAVKAGNHNRFAEKHVPQLKRSLIKGGVWTMYSPDDFDLIDACTKAIEAIDLKLLPGFEVILGLEGLRNLQSIEDMDVLYQLGFRHAMLTWNEENQYATGAKADPKKGLKPLGKTLLTKMQALGMIIDLAHLNEKSFFEALDVVNQNIIYSHGNVKALCGHPRNVTDEQMHALKKVDGLLGLTVAASFIAKDPKDRTMEKFIEHIKYAISIMGIDLVCFGFDFMDYLDEFANSNLNDLSDASKVYNLVNALRNHHFSEEDIEKMLYKNFYHKYKHLITLRG